MAALKSVCQELGMNTLAPWLPFLYHLGASQVPRQTQESLGGHVVTWGSATSSAPHVSHIPVCSETPPRPPPTTAGYVLPPTRMCSGLGSISHLCVDVPLYQQNTGIDAASGATGHWD